MIDYVVEKLLMIISKGGTECNYARNEIVDIIDTLQNQYGYEVQEKK